MFEKARLPNEVLGRVWNLADTEQKGALGMTEFIIAMHLLASLRTGGLRALPQTLPAGLYEAAARRAPPAPIQAIPRQFTGPQAPRPQSPLARPPYVPPSMPTQPLPQQAMSAQALSSQATGAEWLISPQDKAAFDKMFASIDRNNTGYLDGEQAVPFFSNSGLSEDLLATIWDLSDINSEGRLSRDEFAVAMYLIRQQRSKVDDRGSLPTTLPAGLVPPSMRKQAAMPSQSTAPTFDNAAFATQQPKSASDDLFGLDALSTSPEPVSQIQAIKPTAPAPASPRAATSSPSPRQPITTAFKPFAPTSSFGQGLTSQHTGGSVQSSTSSSQAPPSFQPTRAPMTAADDLLGDNDPQVSSKLTADTAELGNMSNQIGTLRNQMQDVQNKKISTGTELNATSNQKRELEARLAQFRTQYEQEVKEVKALEQQLTTTRNDTKRMQQELAMLEGTHADLQTQHNQVSTAFAADQSENTALKDRVRVINENITQLKPQLEKLRSEARQQKGMVAINKKQVATSEGERDKTTGEISELQRQIEERHEQERLERERIEDEHRATAAKLQADREQLAREKAAFEEEKVQRAAADRERAESERISREIADTERSTAVVHAPLPQTVSAVASPAASVSSKNPFFRKSPETQGDRMMSPSIFTEDYSGNSKGADAFDNFFGPSKSSATTAPPPTSFRNDIQGSPQSSGDRDLSGSANAFYPEPHVPSNHHQMNSGNLPLRGLARSDSFSSSLRANPPASSFGVSGHASPLEEPNSPVGSSYGDERETYQHQAPNAQSAHPAAAVNNVASSTTSTPTSGSLTRDEDSRHDRNATTQSTENGFGTNSTQHRETEASPASPSLLSTIASYIPGTHAADKEPTTASPEHHSALDTIASYIPGTQAHADTLSRTTSPEHHSTEHHSTFETIASYIPGTQANADSKTAADEHSESSVTQASQGATSGPTSTSAQSFSQPATGRKDEFPPIREMDDDDSASDDDASGFRDDFTPAHPNTDTSHSGRGNENMPSVTNGSSHAAGKQPARGDGFNGNTDERDVAPPALTAQMSPPTYDQTTSPGGIAHDREANQFPPEFGGLLPSREMVSSPPAESPTPTQAVSPSVAHNEVSASNSFGHNHGSSSFGQSTSAPGYASFGAPNQQSSVFNSTTLPIGHNTVVPQAQEPGSDDFDSAFDDLSEAREVDEPSHDSFSYNRAQTQASEFNTEFDHPTAASRSTVGESYQAPLQTPSAQPDGFIKVRQFTSFAAVPAPITPYAPGNSQQSPTASSFSSSQQAGSPRSPTMSTFSSTQQPVPGPPGFMSQQKATTGSPSFTNYANYAEPTFGSSARNTSNGGFSDFAPSAPNAPQPQTTSRQAPAQTNPNDDWDDLFSGLDNNSNISASHPAPSNGTGTGTTRGADPFAFDDFGTTPASASHRDSTPGPSQARPATYAPPSGPPPPSSRQQQQYAPPPPAGPSLPNRPTPGRALTSGTEHDDPILKSLTSMGYKRDDALKALERFDYNIDAVSFFFCLFFFWCPGRAGPGKGVCALFADFCDF